MADGGEQRRDSSGEMLMTDSERCATEIQSAEALLRNGHPDVNGLCLAV